MLTAACSRSALKTRIAEGYGVQTRDPARTDGCFLFNVAALEFHKRLAVGPYEYKVGVIGLL